MHRIVSILETNPVARWTIFFALIFAFHFSLLFQPALWDSAMCVVPAAMTLASNGFDLLGILKLPNYTQGGPNCHVFSIVTWVLSFVISSVKTESYIPIMHLLMFGCLATGMTALYSFIREKLPTSLAWIACIAILFYPPIFVQSGDFYLEIPLFTFLLMSLRACRKGNWWMSSFWAMAAVFTKEAGVVAGAAATIGAFILHQGNTRQRFGRAGRVALLPILASLTILWLQTPEPKITPEQYGSIFSFDVIMLVVNSLIENGLKRYLLNAPELFLMIFVAIMLSVKHLSNDYGSKRTKTASTPEETLSALTVLCFIGFLYIAMPFAFRFTQPLIRYHIVIVPFCVFLILVEVSKKLGAKAAISLGVTSLVLSVANLDGALYPDFVENFGNDFSIAERSMEYQNLLILQKANLDKIQEFAEKGPVLVSFLEEKYLWYPGNGYVQKTTPGAIRTTKYMVIHGKPDFKLSSISECVYFNLMYPWSEGALNREMVTEARKDPSLQVQTAWTMDVGKFHGEIASIAPRGMSCL